MAEGEMWDQLMDVLKDISSYLEKASPDGWQEQADIDKPPKIKEKQDEISGGAAPSGHPGTEALVKAEEDDGEDVQKAVLAAKGKTQLKKAKEDEDKEEEEDEKEKDDAEELKSLLKDIKNALLTKSSDTTNISSLIDEKIEKSMPKTIEKILRKMGYQVTRPDVMKLGIAESNQFGVEPDIKKSNEKKVEEDPQKIIEDLTKKSYNELARIRTQMGDFKLF